MKLPVAPNRELGQHFLVDENILGVAGRLADLRPATPRMFSSTRKCWPSSRLGATGSFTEG